MRYKAVIFDLDGTLLDTIEDLAKSVNAARQMNGLGAQDTELIKTFIGNGRAKLIRRSLDNDPGEYPEELFDRVFQDNASYYNSHCLGVTRPFDGITELIVRLKGAGYKLACISNKDDEPANELMEHFFPGLFDYVSGSKAGVARKPDPQAVNICMEYLDVQPCDCVYVGDSDVDIKTAENSGMDSISCDWGFKTRSFLVENGARKICSRPSDLWSLL